MWYRISHTWQDQVSVKVSVGGFFFHAVQETWWRGRGSLPTWEICPALPTVKRRVIEPPPSFLFLLSTPISRGATTTVFPLSSLQPPRQKEESNHCCCSSPHPPLLLALAWLYILCKLAMDARSVVVFLDFPLRKLVIFIHPLLRVLLVLSLKFCICNNILQNALRGYLPDKLEYVSSLIIKT